MRILHCCLAAFYIDNYGYQENILPKIHQLQGHEVQIVASTETYIGNKTLGYVEPATYKTKEGIQITRIPYWRWLPRKVVRKLRVYTGLRTVLENFKPEVIFLHDAQFYNVSEIKNYALKNNAKIFADSHTDLINSGRSWISLNVLHRIIYKNYVSKITPFLEKFYGTLPLRMEFLQEIYGVPAEKIDLLPLGADDTEFEIGKRQEIRNNLRLKLNIDDEDFVIISGGKIDRRKNIQFLVNAIKSIRNKKIKLIIFGSVSEEMEDEINYSLSGMNNVYRFGWLSTGEIYNLLFASDLGFFPGTHSVLWEQSVGIGLPCVFKRWEGIEHVDVGGNCIFIENPGVSEISETILTIYKDKALYQSLLKNATEKGISTFSYTKIAEKAIKY